MMTSGGGGSPKTSSKWDVAAEARAARPGDFKSRFRDTILRRLPGATGSGEGNGGETSQRKRCGQK
jgi:hypothetical protein